MNGSEWNNRFHFHRLKTKLLEYEAMGLLPLQKQVWRRICGQNLTLLNLMWEKVHAIPTGKILETGLPDAVVPALFETDDPLDEPQVTPHLITRQFVTDMDIPQVLELLRVAASMKMCLGLRSQSKAFKRNPEQAPIVWLHPSFPQQTIRKLLTKPEFALSRITQFCIIPYKMIPHSNSNPQQALNQSRLTAVHRHGSASPSTHLPDASSNGQ